jgi:hypothetical protein
MIIHEMGRRNQGQWRNRSARSGAHAFSTCTARQTPLDAGPAPRRDHADMEAVIGKIELTEFRQETRATSHSVDEQLAELKDLIIGRRNDQ